jgi:hypothetical protein
VIVFLMFDEERNLMIAARRGDGASLSPGRDLAQVDDNMVEMTLFLPQDQAQHLEEAAESCGMTVGQMVRRVIRDFTSRRHIAGQNS